MTQSDAVGSPAAVLSKVLLAHAPVISAERRTTGTRLTVVPCQSGGDVSLLSVWKALVDLWGERRLPVSLNTPLPPDAEFLATAEPHAAFTLELASANVVDARGMAVVLKLHQAGFQLAIRGRPQVPLPDQLLRCFQYSVLDLSEDRRRDGSGPPAAGIERRIPFKLTGISSVQDLEAAFARGAQGLVGWPIDDLPGQSGKALQTNLQSVTEAMRQVDRNAPPAQIEEAMRSDPTLTYRLLKYINSAGFGLLSEARSIREAVMMLGYAPLKRWLVVLLATSVKDSNRIPVAYASLRRGLFLEALVDRKSDATLADELFMLGIFSLMDRLMGKPREELFAGITLAEPVAEALLRGTGSHADFLLLAERHESAEPRDLSSLLEGHFITQARCNHAVLMALLQAHELEMNAGA